MTREKKTPPLRLKADFRLLPEGYWTQPVDTAGKTGGRTFDEVHLAVGRTLSAWEELEQNFRTLFMRITGESTSQSECVKVFGSIDNSGARFKVLMAAAERRFGRHWQQNEIKWTFESLKSNYEAAAHRRNEIAHGIAVDARKIDPVRSDPGMRTGVFLVAPRYMTGRNREPHAPLRDFSTIQTNSLYCYNADDIMSLVERIYEFGNKVQHLGSRVTLNSAGIPEMLAEILAAAEASRESKE